MGNEENNGISYWLIWNCMQLFGEWFANFKKK